MAIFMKDPQAYFDQLEIAPYNFKLKGWGPLIFHLGCGFQRNSTDTLCMDPGKYMDQMKEAFVQHFGTKPVQKYRSLLQKYDPPELDTTLLFGQKGTEKCQLLVSSCQWNISIGRFDT